MTPLLQNLWSDEMKNASIGHATMNMAQRQNSMRHDNRQKSSNKTCESKLHES